MNQETIKQVKQEIAPLAEKLGEGAEFTYEVFVRQQLINGAVSLAIIILMTAIIGVIWYKMYKFEKARKQEETIYDFGDNGFFIFVSIGALVWLVLFPFMLHHAIMQLANPHYYAIQELIRMVTGS